MRTAVFVLTILYFLPLILLCYSAENAAGNLVPALPLIFIYTFEDGLLARATVRLLQRPTLSYTNSEIPAPCDHRHRSQLMRFGRTEHSPAIVQISSAALVLEDQSST